MRPAQVILFLASLASAREVPTKKAMPPLMDPIPTMPEITHRVYFDIEIDGQTAGKVTFGLFGKNAPEAAENFLALATCSSKGKGKTTGSKLCYKGSKFHRVIPNFAIQGGDFENHDGTGGESIYGGKFTATMRELTKFNRPNMLATAAASDKAGSQFFVTTVKAQWLTGKHAIFGMVLEGADVVEEISKNGTYGGSPRATITIVECGEEPLLPEDKEPHY